MASQDIRLRLVIRRHGVPEVKLVWPCACTDNFTISRLLEQVNEVITLESGEWGLEDYAVELSDGKGGSFECLHFQPVGRILKDEDQVLIRSLLSDDLKCRRLSGRHQITADGSHLVDGVAFGRTRFRAPRDRPVVDLPPRKRARVSFDLPDDEEEHAQAEFEEEEEESQLRLLLEGPRGSSRGEAGDAEDDLSALDDEEDFEMSDVDEEDEYGDEDGDDVDQYDDGGEDLAAEVDDLARENMLLEHYTAEEDIMDNGIRGHSEAHVQVADASLDGPAQDEERDADADADADFLVDEDDEDNDDDDDQDDDEDDEDDDDEATLDQGVEDLEEEIRLLRKENELVEEDPAADSTPTPERPRKLRKLSGPLNSDDASDYVGLPNGDIIALLKATFPSVPVDQVSSKVKEMRGDVARVYLSLASTAKAQCSFDDFMDVALLGLPQAPPEKVSIEALTNRAPPKSKGPLIQVVEEVDHHEQPIANGVAMSPVKKSVRIVEVVEEQDSEDTTEDSEEVESDTSSSEEISSSGQISEAAFVHKDQSVTISSGESRSEAKIEPATRSSQGEGIKKRAREETSEEEEPSTDEEDSDSESSSEDELETQGGQGARLRSGPAADVADEDEAPSDASSDASSDESSILTSASEEEPSDGDSSSDDDEPQEVSSKSNPTVQAVRSSPKQQGPKSSSSSHPKEKASQSHSAPQTNNQPVVAPGLGMSKTQKRNARRRKYKQMLHAKAMPNAPADISLDELFARKQALLAAIASQPETLVTDTPAQPVEPAQPAPAPKSFIVEIPQEAPPKPEQEKSMETHHESSKNCSRLDTGAGRRLLFGALGMKAPKNKVDEEKVKQALMKDVRPLPNPRMATEHPPTKAAVAEDMDSWRDKIIYSAVECCYNDMELSEPPFPFVQRWDPQQRIDKMRKRKRQSENYETSFVGDDSIVFDQASAAQTQSASKKKSVKGKSVTIEQKPEQDSDEAKEDSCVVYDDDSHISSQFTDFDDLPSLPRDLASLPALSKETAKPGTVITWKQLLMSKATKWQPELVPITGLVLQGSTDTTLRLILAKRDREKNERLYDEETGERVYGKFEVPDLDDMEEEDLGYRFVAWVELIEPKLLQKPLATLIPAMTTVGEPAAGAATGETSNREAVDVSMQMGSFAEGAAEASGNAKARVQVSDYLANDESMEVEVSATQQTTVAMEEDSGLQGIGAEEDEDHSSMMELETQENSEMVSIESGQRMPRFGDSSFVLDSVITENEEMPQSGGDDTSRTMENESAEAMDGVETTRPGRPASRDPPVSTTGEMDGTTADVEADPEECIGDTTDDAGAFDVDGIMSKPMFSFVQEEFPPREIPSETFAHLALPSSQPSPGSRQPDLLVDDSVGDETTVVQDPLPRLRERTPISSKGMTQPQADSSSPFPSIEELFRSTGTSQKQPATQTSMMDVESPAAEPKKTRKNMDYEAAMRQFDEGRESDDSDGDYFPNSTQPSTSARSFKKESQGFTAKSFDSEGVHSAHQSFVVPAEVEVISISSSSPAPATTKKRRTTKKQRSGDEEEDEPAESSPRKSVLPQGPGWKKKFHSPPEYSSSAPSRSRSSGSRISRRKGSQKMEGFYVEWE